MSIALEGYRIERIQMREEEYLFYSDAEKDAERGCIGHLRGDFGRSGKEFHTDWSDHAGAKDHKNEVFQKELKDLIELLRMDVLADCSRMLSYCCEHKECRNAHSHTDSCWGFRILTENYVYYLRCTPVLGDVNFYCYAYHRETLFASLAKERGLLPHCFDRLDGKLITIFLGETGYYPMPLHIDEASLAELNREIGATKAQLAAMKCGSMYGWNVPGADPKSYDEDGHLIPDQPTKEARKTNYLRLHSYGQTYAVAFGIEHYSENGNLALEMSYKNEDNMDEPFTMLTVNLSEKCAPNCAYVDTNDNPWAESFIAEHGLGVPTGRTRRSGFCEYPEYAFDMQKIEQHLLCQPEESQIDGEEATKNDCGEAR